MVLDQPSYSLRRKNLTIRSIAVKNMIQRLNKGALLIVSLRL